MSRCKPFGVLVAIALGAIAIPGLASAGTLTLSQVNDNSAGPQSTSNPCVIAGTNCSQPAGFGFNNFTSSGAISSFNMFSTTPTGTVADGVKGSPYTVSQITGVAGGHTTFNIAIDVNTTNAHGETLGLFEVLLCTGGGGTNCSTTSVIDTTGNLNTPQNIGFPSNNGNGFGDFLLSTVNLTGLASTALVLFHAIWSGASDGAESFFIVGATPNVFVPLPPAALLFGSGLLGMAFLRRRRQKTQVSAAA